MKCIQCCHTDLQAYPKHSAVGVAPCKVQEPLPGGITVFESLESERNCAKFVSADPAMVAKRIAWREKQRFNGVI